MSYFFLTFALPSYGLKNKQVVAELGMTRSYDNNHRCWSSHCGSAVETRLVSLASLSGLRVCIAVSCDVGSGIAVAMTQAGSCSSDSTPILGTSICRRCSPKRTERKEGKKENESKPHCPSTQLWCICRALSAGQTGAKFPGLG